MAERTRNGTPSIVDMGADAFFDNGDFNYDGIVNFLDFAMFAENWLIGQQEIWGHHRRGRKLKMVGGVLIDNG